MLLYHTPDSICKLFPKVLFHLPRGEKTLYLTFDDGPHPTITSWVIDLLQEYHAKGTFFCVGENLENNPAFVELFKNSGHVIGNHSYNHLNGWKTQTEPYLENVSRFQEVYASTLFRPPYGKISNKQLESVNSEFQVVLWDVLTGDFNNKLSVDHCFKHIIKHTEPGSILVFHDSLKAEKTLRGILPRVLDHYSKLGFKFEAIPAIEK